MFRLFVATIAAVSLLLWQPAYGRRAEAQVTLSASITIVSMCETAVDEISRQVSERCNIPYRINTVEIAPRISMGNAIGAASGSNILGSSLGAPCTPQSDCIVTVIYY